MCWPLEYWTPHWRLARSFVLLTFWKCVYVLTLWRYRVSMLDSTHTQLQLLLRWINLADSQPFTFISSTQIRFFSAHSASKLLVLFVIYRYFFFFLLNYCYFSNVIYLLEIKELVLLQNNNKICCEHLDTKKVLVENLTVLKFQVNLFEYRHCARLNKGLRIDVSLIFFSNIFHNLLNNCDISIH